MTTNTPNALLDVNALLALTLTGHSGHSAIARWLESQPNEFVLLLNRVTEMGLLHLLTQRGPMEHCQVQPFSNEQAIAQLERLLLNGKAQLLPEPSLLNQHWPRIASSSLSSHRIWTDAYLAAFAISANLRLVTFDKGFRNYQRHGLKLELLEK